MDSQKSKHAYLIMCHNEQYILEKLIRQIDSENNDIYLHVDKKYKNFNKNYFSKIVKKSSIFFVNRMNVKWSSFSQIKCEFFLLKEATKKKYSYYHLLSGVDLLIKNNKKIYDFFEKNKGKEFVAFSSLKSISDFELERIQYYHFLNGNRRSKNKLNRKISGLIHQTSLLIQKNLKINRLKNYKKSIRKGANWFSITDDLANFILKNRKEIYKYFSYSNCADELFLQTLVYNSSFINNLYKEYNDEHADVKRYIDWQRGEPYTFKREDYKELISSDAFFARKFSTKTDKLIIDKIYNFTNAEDENNA